MATSDVKVTPGTGKNVATNSITEDAETKELQRIVVNTSAGAEAGTSASPLEVNLRTSTVGVATSAKQDTGNTSLSSIDGKITAVNTGAVVVSSGSITANAGTNLNTSALALDATLAGAIKAEDAASADGDKGIPALAVRKATPANTSGTDGDYENLQISAGRLWASTVIDTALPVGTNSIGKISDITTSVVPGTAATNLGKAEDAAHTSGDVGVMSLSVRNDTRGALAGTDGDYSPLQLNASGDARTEVSSLAGTAVDTNSGNKSAGTQRVVIATDQVQLTNALKVDPSAVTSPVSNAALTTLNTAIKVEDVASQNADTGFPAMAIRDDTLNATSGTEGDYEFLHTTADGALWVTQAPSTTNGWSTAMMSSGDGSTALTNTAQAIKASAGTLGGWYIYNPNSSATYVIVYNTAFGSVTVGTTNPQMVLCIPATSAANVEFGNGINFTTAMSAAATTTGGGNSAPATALEANFYYK